EQALSSRLLHLRSLVAFPLAPDLLFRAKHLFVAAIMAGPRPGRLGRHAQLRKIRHFPARRRVASRSPDDRPAGFHGPIAPTNSTAMASPWRGLRRNNLPRYLSGRSLHYPSVAFALGVAL